MADTPEPPVSEPSTGSGPSDPPFAGAMDDADENDVIQFDDDESAAETASQPASATPVPIVSAAASTQSKSVSPAPTASVSPVPPALKLAGSNGAKAGAAAEAQRAVKRPFSAIDGAAEGKVGWADLVVLIDALLEQGVVACLDGSAVSTIVLTFFEACRHNSTSDIVMMYLQKLRLTHSGQQKAVLFNLLTAFWVRCWGRKWAPPAHAKVDMVLRTVLLQALRFSTVHTGPEANADVIDATICSWCYLELVDTQYLDVLRSHLFELKQPIGAEDGAENS